MCIHQGTKRAKNRFLNASHTCSFDHALHTPSQCKGARDLMEHTFRLCGQPNLLLSLAYNLAKL